MGENGSRFSAEPPRSIDNNGVVFLIEWGEKLRDSNRPLLFFCAFGNENIHFGFGCLHPPRRKTLGIAVKQSHF